MLNVSLPPDHFAQLKLILVRLQYSKILGTQENREKLFKPNVYFVPILMRFYAYSNHSQSL